MVRRSLPLLGCLLVCTLQGRSQQLTWNDLNGVPGVTFLDQTLDGKCYGVSGTRIYTSTDDGVVWNRPAPVTGSVELFYTNGTELVVSRFVGGPYPHQVFTSTDEGTTWNLVFYEPTPIFASLFGDFFLSDSGALYAFHGVTTVSSQLFRLRPGTSSQSGTFIPIGNPVQGFPTVYAIDHANVIYAGDPSSGLYRTTDFGTTWTLSLPYAVNAIMPKPGNFMVVAADSTPSLDGGVFVSNNHGVTWTNVGLPETHFTAIDADSAGNILASTFLGSYYYTASTQSWNFVGPVERSLSAVFITREGVLLSASADDGVFRSTDKGNSWSLNGPRNQDVSASIELPSGTILAGSLGSRIFTSVNAGLSWQQSAAGTVADYVYSFLLYGAKVLASTDQGLFSSNDEGQHWTNISSSQVSGSAFAVTSTPDGALFIATNFGVYASRDGGASWGPSGLSSSRVNSLVSDPAGNLYAATSIDGIFVSSDGGGTWSSRGLVRNDIQSLAVNSRGEIFVGVYGGIFKSTDLPNGWGMVPFTNDYVYALSVNSFDQVYAGTLSGVYASVDGNSFTGAGMTGNTVLSLSFGPDNRVFAGVYQGGLSQSAQAVTEVRTGNSDFPKSFTLGQNYPNPFNPTTTVEFEIAKLGPVSLKIFDILGNEVATLLNRRLIPGRYTVQWNAAHAASGTYYYRLSTTASTEVKKMVLVR